VHGVALAACQPAQCGKADRHQKVDGKQPELPAYDGLTAVLQQQLDAQPQHQQRTHASQRGCHHSGPLQVQALRLKRHQAVLLAPLRQAAAKIGDQGVHGSRHCSTLI